MGLTDLWTPLPQAAQTPLSALDLALANALQTRQPSDDERHRIAHMLHRLFAKNRCMRDEAL